ncbi:hypothetical protein IIA79_00830 [bacterium]|nr:hypothetical protein [bacterium]
MRIYFIAALLVLGLQGLAQAAEWIYIYEDGQAVGYSVGADFEFYEVAIEDIHEENQALLGSLPGYGPWHTLAGYGQTEYNSTVFNAEHYGIRRGGPFIQDLFVRDYLSPGDWQGIFGDHYHPEALYVELDKSGPHWSLDATAFARFGYVYGHDYDGNPTRAERRRHHAELTWRRGSMEGGVWRVRSLAYDVITGDSLQAKDVKHMRVEAEFRRVEPGYVLEGGVYQGMYRSEGAHMSNTFTGARLEGDTWLGESLGLHGDARVTSIDARKQDGTVVRGDFGGSVTWELGEDWTLTGTTRRISENSDIAANSHLTGYTDVGGRLSYRPKPARSVSVGYRHREVQAERLRLEDDGIFALIYASPPSTRADMAGLRVDSSAESDRLDMRGNLRLNKHWYLGASFSNEDFGERPLVGNFTDDNPAPPYFADERQQSSVHLRYDTRRRGSVTLRSDYLSRSNSERQSSYRYKRHFLGFSAPLSKESTWTAGVSKNDSSVNLVGDGQDWNGNSWNYELTLSGEADWAGYRVSYNRQLVDSTWGGNYDSIGMELTFRGVPLYLSTWYRDQADALGGFGAYHDFGVNLAYQITMQ